MFICPGYTSFTLSLTGIAASTRLPVTIILKKANSFTLELQLTWIQNDTLANLKYIELIYMQASGCHWNNSLQNESMTCASSSIKKLLVSDQSTFVMKDLVPRTLYKVKVRGKFKSGGKAIYSKSWEFQTISFSTYCVNLEFVY